MQDEDTLSEKDMRNQMFLTMQALERAANAYVEHLAADKSSPDVDMEVYGNMHAMCSKCQGTVVLHDFDRNPHDEHDTCACGDGVRLEDIGLAEGVKAHYRRVWAERAPKPNPATAPVSALVSELAEIRKTLEKHKKALAIIGTYAKFESGAHGSPPRPREVVKELAGLASCNQCVGTGWLDRDERCQSCRGNGYVSL